MSDNRASPETGWLRFFLQIEPREWTVIGSEATLTLDHKGKSHVIRHDDLKRVAPDGTPEAILAAVALLPGAEQRNNSFRAGDRVGLWWVEQDDTLFLIAMGEASPGQDILRLERIIPKSGCTYGHLQFSADPDVIGPTYPQVRDFHNPPDPSTDSDRAYSRPHADFLDGSVDLTLFEMHGQTRMTDLASSSILTSTGIIVSEKMQAILEAASIPDAAAYPCVVHHRGTAHNMTFLQLLESRAVDWTTSTFVTEVPGDPDSRQPVEATSLDALHAVRTELIHRPGRPYLLPHLVCVPSAPDLFRMPVTRKMYISERLQGRLAEADVTGYRIDDLDVTIA